MFVQKANVAKMVISLALFAICQQSLLQSYLSGRKRATHIRLWSRCAPNANFIEQRAARRSLHSDFSPAPKSQCKVKTNIPVLARERQDTQ